VQTAPSHRQPHRKFAACHLRIPQKIVLADNGRKEPAFFMRAAAPNASARSIACLEKCIRPKRESGIVPPRQEASYNAGGELNSFNHGNIKMRPRSKKVTASAATLFTFAFFVMTAPAAYAEEYCVTGGSNSVNSCGYSTMEQCQAASSGRGGMCVLHAPVAQSPSNALAYQPKQRHSRSERHANKEPANKEPAN
jgi:hypothetical protein